MDSPLLLILGTAVGITAILILSFVGWRSRHAFLSERGGVRLSSRVSNVRPIAGEVLIFEIFLTNSGQNNVSDIIVTNQFPPSLDTRSALATKGEYSSENNLWRVPALEPGDSATLIVESVVDPIAIGRTLFAVSSLTREANEATQPSDNPAILQIDVQGADLRITLSGPDEAMQPEREFAITAAITNLGPSHATGIKIISKTLPNLQANRSTASDGRYDGRTQIWELDSLSVMQTAILELVLLSNRNSPREPSTVCRFEILACDQGAVPPQRSSSELTIPSRRAAREPLRVAHQEALENIPIADVASAPELKLAFDADTLNPTRGGIVVYTLSLTNMGSVQTGPLEIVDMLPEGITMKDAISSVGAYNRQSSIIGVWEIDKLERSDSASLILKAEVDPDIPDGVFLSRAFVSTEPYSGQVDAAIEIEIAADET